MLVSYIGATKELISATFIDSEAGEYNDNHCELISGLNFVELPDDQLSAHIYDYNLAKQIWEVHTAGEQVFLSFDVEGSVIGISILAPEEVTSEEILLADYSVEEQ